MKAAGEPNRLAKASAHLRWFLESEGIDPEKVLVSIAFPDQPTLAIFGDAVREAEDGKVVRTPFPNRPEVAVAHGLNIVGVVAKREKAR